MGFRNICPSKGHTDGDKILLFKSIETVVIKDLFQVDLHTFSSIKTPLKVVSDCLRVLPLIQ